MLSEIRFKTALHEDACYVEHKGKRPLTKPREIEAF